MDTINDQYDLQSYLQEDRFTSFNSASHAVRHVAEEYFLPYSHGEDVLGLTVEDLRTEEFARWLVAGTNRTKPTVDEQLLADVLQKAKEIAQRELAGEQHEGTTA